MKKFLLSLTLFTALLGITISASAQPCTIRNLVFTVVSYKDNGNGTCTMKFNVGWDQLNNGGYTWSVVHLWFGEKYPTTPINYSQSVIPTSAQLANTIGTIAVTRGNQNSPWTLSETYPGGSTKMLSGVFTATPVTNGTSFLLSGIEATFSCPTNFSVKGDVWGSNKNKGEGAQCFNPGLVFVPPADDLKVSGSLQCGFKNGLPDNKINVLLESTNASAFPVTVSYDVYVDNGDNSFNSSTDIKVAGSTKTGLVVYNNNSYSSGLEAYSPYSNQYQYYNRVVWVVAQGSTTVGDVPITFTRLYSISNSCTTPPPTGNPDYFVLGMDGWEGNTPLKAHVYGNYAKWANDPIAAGHQVSSLSTSPAVNSGTDGDNTDAPLSAMKFTFSGLTLENGPACESASPNLGTLTTNEKGFFEYAIGDPCVNVVSFTYTIENTLSGLTTGPIKVTIQISAPIILPVSYASFTATRANNNQVVLEWETAMEENNKGFHVQRNVDGSWKNIGFVFSQANGGNSTEVLKYAFKDANNSKGISQYRILQVDIDGKGKYSQIRSVHGLETAARVVLFPNPSSTGSFSLLFEDATSVRDVVVSDVSGRVVKQFKAVSGSTLTVDGLIDGFYTVQVANRTSGTASVEKVIIKKR